jgi:phosphopantothenoylcysteine decarboxylase
MANLLLGFTGSVAAVRAPLLLESFQTAGHTVRAVATKAATHFFDVQPWRTQLVLDEDEWPGDRYRRGDAVLHIELRKWADAFIIAPLDAHTLAKLAVGLADNCLMCVWRAWDWSKPVLLAPAMNTLMWEHPFTVRHLKSLGADFGAGHIPGHLNAEQLITQINARAQRLQIVPPITKELACGDIGIGAMAEVHTILAAATCLLATSASSPSPQTL